jgi:hypothetical protein
MTAAMLDPVVAPETPVVHSGSFTVDSIVAPETPIIGGGDFEVFETARNFDAATNQMDVEVEVFPTPGASMTAIAETLAFTYRTADGNGSMLQNKYITWGDMTSATARTKVKYWINNSSYSTTSVATNGSGGLYKYKCKDLEWKVYGDNLTCENVWMDYSTGYTHFENVRPVPRSPADMIRGIIDQRMAPIAIIARTNIIRPVSDIKELRARETLKLILGQDLYERFLRKGFVSVRNPRSLRVYQIFPGHGFTKVYENGKCIEQLCVVLKGDFPPTDSLIVRYLMAINNEEELWKLSNKHGAFKKPQSRVVGVETRSLPEIFRELKERAA